MIVFYTASDYVRHKFWQYFEAQLQEIFICQIL